MTKEVKIRLVSLAVCIALVATGLLAMNGFFFLVEQIQASRGFDYDAKIAKNPDWSGPKPGEVIETTHLADSKAMTLYNSVKNDLILLTIVDPKCGACRQSRDQIISIAEKLKNERVDYFIASFSPGASAAKLEIYVDSMEVKLVPLVWTNGIDNVLPSIKTSVIPSHILMDSAGTVIKTFPGTSPEKSIRNRMTRQIVADVVNEIRRPRSSG